MLKLNTEVKINGGFYMGHQGKIVQIQDDNKVTPEKPKYGVLVSNKEGTCKTYQPAHRLNVVMSLEDLGNWKVKMIQEVNDVMNKYLKNV